MFKKAHKTQPRKNTFVFENLEPRILLSADVAALSELARESLEQTAEHQLIAPPTESTSQTQEHSLIVGETNKLLYLIDANIANAHLIEQDLLAQHPHLNIVTEQTDISVLRDHKQDQPTLIYLDNTQSGLDQLQRLLVETQQQPDAIHIFSHGSAGKIHLGATQISLDNIDALQSQLNQIGQQLSDEADILFYACDVSATETGRMLIQKIAQYTQADIAASDNKTGHAPFADWKLETNIGSVEAEAFAVSDYDGLLADETFDIGLTDLNHGGSAVLFADINDPATFIDYEVSKTLIDVPYNGEADQEIFWFDGQGSELYLADGTPNIYQINDPESSTTVSEGTYRLSVDQSEMSSAPEETDLTLYYFKNDVFYHITLTLNYFDPDAQEEGLGEVQDELPLEEQDIGLLHYQPSGATPFYVTDYDDLLTHEVEVAKTLQIDKTGSTTQEVLVLLPLGIAIGDVGEAVDFSDLPDVIEDEAVDFGLIETLAIVSDPNNLFSLISDYETLEGTGWKLTMDQSGLDDLTTTSGLTLHYFNGEVDYLIELNIELIETSEPNQQPVITNTETHFSMSLSEMVANAYDTGLVVNAIDPNQNDELTYHVDRDEFVISKNGAMAFNSQQALPNPGDYSVTVTVADAAGLTDTQTFNFSLTDVPVIESTEFNVLAGEIAIGQLDVSDFRGTEKSGFSYAFVNTSDEAIYGISPNGWLSFDGVAPEYDPEADIEKNGYNRYEVAIKVVSDHGQEAFKTLIIQVQSTNDYAPEIDASGDFYVTENQTAIYEVDGVTLNRLSATDLDNNPLSWDITDVQVMGESVYDFVSQPELQNAFELLEIEGEPNHARLALMEGFDFENLIDTTLYVTLEVTDGEHTDSQVYTLHVLNDKTEYTATQQANLIEAFDHLYGFDESDGTFSVASSNPLLEGSAQGDTHRTTVNQTLSAIKQALADPDFTNQSWKTGDIADYFANFLPSFLSNHYDAETRTAQITLDIPIMTELTGVSLTDDALSGLLASLSIEGLGLSAESEILLDGELVTWIHLNWSVLDYVDLLDTSSISVGLSEDHPAGLVHQLALSQLSGQVTLHKDSTSIDLMLQDVQLGGQTLINEVTGVTQSHRLVGYEILSETAPQVSHTADAIVWLLDNREGEAFRYQMNLADSAASEILHPLYIDDWLQEAGLDGVTLEGVGLALKQAVSDEVIKAMITELDIPYLSEKAYHLVQPSWQALSDWVDEAVNVTHVDNITGWNLVDRLDDYVSQLNQQLQLTTGLNQTLIALDTSNPIFEIHLAIENQASQSAAMEIAPNKDWNLAFIDSESLLSGLPSLEVAIANQIELGMLLASANYTLNAQNTRLTTSAKVSSEEATNINGYLVLQNEAQGAPEISLIAQQGQFDLDWQMEGALPDNQIILDDDLTSLLPTADWLAEHRVTASEWTTQLYGPTSGEELGISLTSDINFDAAEQAFRLVNVLTHNDQQVDSIFIRNALGLNQQPHISTTEVNLMEGRTEGVQITATDGNGDPLIFSMTDDSGLFTISESGVFSLKNSDLVYDPEADNFDPVSNRNVFTLSVHVTEDNNYAGPSVSKVLEVSVSQRDHAPEITTTTTEKSLTLTELSLANYSTGMVLNYTDDTLHENHRITLSNQAFSVDDQGVIYFDILPEPGDYAVTITVTDSADLSDSQIFTFYITDVPEIESEYFNVLEGRTQVGTIQATDFRDRVLYQQLGQDAPLDLNFSMITGTDIFDISNDGLLSFKTAPVYNTLDLSQNLYQAEIKVTDSDGEFASKVINVQVNHQNTAPYIQTANLMVNEGEIEAGHIMVSDDTDRTDALNFAITGGSDENHFQFSNETSGLLRFKSLPVYDPALDPEQKGYHTYEVEITVMDAEHSASVQTLTVQVKDVNHVPVIDAYYDDFYVTEKQTTLYAFDPNTLIADQAIINRLVASDLDGDSLSWTLEDVKFATGNEGEFESRSGFKALFNIILSVGEKDSPDRYQLALAKGLDLESLPATTLYLDLKVSDGHHSAMHTYRLTILDDTTEYTAVQQTHLIQVFDSLYGFDENSRAFESANTAILVQNSEHNEQLNLALTQLKTALSDPNLLNQSWQTDDLSSYLSGLLTDFPNTSVSRELSQDTFKQAQIQIEIPIVTDLNDVLVTDAVLADLLSYMTIEALDVTAHSHLMLSGHITSSIQLNWQITQSDSDTDFELGFDDFNPIGLTHQLTLTDLTGHIELIQGGSQHESSFLALQDIQTASGQTWINLDSSLTQSLELNHYHLGSSSPMSPIQSGDAIRFILDNRSDASAFMFQKHLGNVTASQVLETLYIDDWLEEAGLIGVRLDDIGLHIRTALDTAILQAQLQHHETPFLEGLTYDWVIPSWSEMTGWVNAATLYLEELGPFEGWNLFDQLDHYLTQLNDLINQQVQDQEEQDFFTLSDTASGTQINLDIEHRALASVEMEINPSLDWGMTFVNDGLSLQGLENLEVEMNHRIELGLMLSSSGTVLNSQNTRFLTTAKAQNNENLRGSVILIRDDQTQPSVGLYVEQGAYRLDWQQEATLDESQRISVDESGLNSLTYADWTVNQDLVNSGLTAQLNGPSSTDDLGISVTSSFGVDNHSMTLSHVFTNTELEPVSIDDIRSALALPSVDVVAFNEHFAETIQTYKEHFSSPLASFGEQATDIQTHQGWLVLEALTNFSEDFVPTQDQSLEYFVNQANATLQSLEFLDEQMNFISLETEGLMSRLKFDIASESSEVGAFTLDLSDLLNQIDFVAEWNLDDADSPLKQAKLLANETVDFKLDFSFDLSQATPIIRMEDSSVLNTHTHLTFADETATYSDIDVLGGLIELDYVLLANKSVIDHSNALILPDSVVLSQEETVNLLNQENIDQQTSVVTLSVEHKKDAFLESEPIAFQLELVEGTLVWSLVSGDADRIFYSQVYDAFLGGMESLMDGMASGMEGGLNFAQLPFDATDGLSQSVNAFMVDLKSLILGEKAEDSLYYTSGMGALLQNAAREGLGPIELLQNGLYEVLGEALYKVQYDEDNNLIKDDLTGLLSLSKLENTKEDKAQLAKWFINDEGLVTGFELDFIVQQEVDLPPLNLNLSSLLGNVLDVVLHAEVGIETALTAATRFNVVWDLETGLILKTEGVVQDDNNHNDEMALILDLNLTDGSQMGVDLGVLEGAVTGDHNDRISGVIAVDFAGAQDDDDGWNITGEDQEGLALSGRANLLLDMSLETEVSALDFMKVSANLVLGGDWEASISPESGIDLPEMTVPKVLMQDVALDLGRLGGDVLSPMAENFSKVLEPMAPIIEALRTELEFLPAEYNNVAKFLDQLYFMYQNVHQKKNLSEANKKHNFEKLVEVYDALVSVSDTINTIDGAGVMHLGDFSLTDFALDDAKGMLADFSDVYEGLNGLNSGYLTLQDVDDLNEYWVGWDNDILMELMENMRDEYEEGNEALASLLKQLKTYSETSETKEIAGFLSAGAFLDHRVVGGQTGMSWIQGYAFIDQLELDSLSVNKQTSLKSHISDSWDTIIDQDWSQLTNWMSEDFADYVDQANLTSDPSEENIAVMVSAKEALSLHIETLTTKLQSDFSDYSADITELEMQQYIELLVDYRNAMSELIDDPVEVSRWIVDSVKEMQEVVSILESGSDEIESNATNLEEDSELQNEDTQNQKQNADHFKETLKQYGSSETASDGGNIHLDIPLITGGFSPIYNLLTNRPTDIFTLNMATEDAEGNWIADPLVIDAQASLQIPIISPLLNAEIGGEFSAEFLMGFGLDTRGFLDWKAQDYALDQVYNTLYKGLYISDNVYHLDEVGNQTGVMSNGEFYTYDPADPNDDRETQLAQQSLIDLDELVLDLTIKADLVIDAKLLRAGVGGGIESEASLNLNDIGHYASAELNDETLIFDGKAYLDELARMISKGPECVFDFQASADAFLEAFIWMGIDMGFYEATLFEEEVEIARINLFEIENNCLLTDERPYKLAELTDEGELKLTYFQTEADYQSYQSTGGINYTGAYNYSLAYEHDTTHEYQGVEVANEDWIKVSNGSFSELFLAKDIVKISTLGSVLNDNFWVKDSLDQLNRENRPDLIIELRGGAGDDRIQFDTAHERIQRIALGEEGQDSLKGSSGADVLYGGSGNDVLIASGVSSHLDSDSEEVGSATDHPKDVLDAGSGNDRIVSGQGQVDIIGGEGQDMIYLTAYANDNLNQVFVEGGEGNDIFKLTSVKNSTSSFELIGGEGFDQLTLASPLEQIETLDGVDVYEKNHVSLEQGSAEGVLSLDIRFDGANFSLTEASSIESLNIDTSQGEDTVEIGDLSGVNSIIHSLDINLGQKISTDNGFFDINPDDEEDHLILNTTEENDQIALKTTDFLVSAVDETEETTDQVTEDDTQNTDTSSLIYHKPQIQVAYDLDFKDYIDERHINAAEYQVVSAQQSLEVTDLGLFNQPELFEDQRYLSYVSWAETNEITDKFTLDSTTGQLTLNELDLTDLDEETVYKVKLKVQESELSVNTDPETQKNHPILIREGQTHTFEVAIIVSDEINTNKAYLNSQFGKDYQPDVVGYAFIWDGGHSIDYEVIHLDLFQAIEARDETAENPAKSSLHDKALGNVLPYMAVSYEWVDPTHLTSELDVQLKANFTSADGSFDQSNYELFKTNADANLFDLSSEGELNFKTTAEKPYYYLSWIETGYQAQVNEIGGVELKEVSFVKTMVAHPAEQALLNISYLSEDSLTLNTLGGHDTINAQGIVDEGYLKTLTINSGAGDDVITGSYFDDVINSGAGNDRVEGGLGSDTFGDERGDQDIFVRSQQDYPGMAISSDLVISVESNNIEAFETELTEFVSQGKGKLQLNLSPILSENVLNTLEALVLNTQQGHLQNTTEARLFATLTDGHYRQITMTGYENIAAGQRVFEFLFENETLANAYEMAEITTTENPDQINVLGWSNSANLDGRGDSDLYQVQLKANDKTSTTIEITDSGNDSGSDSLTILGSDQADVLVSEVDSITKEGYLAVYSDSSLAVSPPEFGENHSNESSVTLDNSTLNGNMQKVVYGQAPDYEKGLVTSLRVDEVVVKLGKGNDIYVSYDNAAQFDVYGEEGSDQFIIGVVTEVLDVVVDEATNKSLAVVAEGGMSHGVTYNTDFFGGAGDDYFEINHNAGKVGLHGESGNDLFYVQAHLMITGKDTNGKVSYDYLVPKGDSSINLSESDQNGDYVEGENEDAYSDTVINQLSTVSNHSVTIDGGSGFDALGIGTTPLDDTLYVYTEEEQNEAGEWVKVLRIYGAGLQLEQVVNVERIVLLTGQGNDTIYVNSLEAENWLEIYTGAGDDTVYVGGDAQQFSVEIPPNVEAFSIDLPKQWFMGNVASLVTADTNDMASEAQQDYKAMSLDDVLARLYEESVQYSQPDVFAYIRDNIHKYFNSKVGVPAIFTDFYQPGENQWHIDEEHFLLIANQDGTPINSNGQQIVGGDFGYQDHVYYYEWQSLETDRVRITFSPEAITQNDYHQLTVKTLQAESETVVKTMPAGDLTDIKGTLLLKDTLGNDQIQIYSQSNWVSIMGADVYANEYQVAESNDASRFVPYLGDFLLAQPEGFIGSDLRNASNDFEIINGMAHWIPLVMKVAGQQAAYERLHKDVATQFEVQNQLYQGNLVNQINEGEWLGTRYQNDAAQSVPLISLQDQDRLIWQGDANIVTDHTAENFHQYAELEYTRFANTEDYDDQINNTLNLNEYDVTQASDLRRDSLFFQDLLSLYHKLDQDPTQNRTTDTVAELAVFTSDYSSILGDISIQYETSELFKNWYTLTKETLKLGSFDAQSNVFHTYKNHYIEPFEAVLEYTSQNEYDAVLAQFWQTYSENYKLGYFYEGSLSATWLPTLELFKEAFDLNHLKNEVAFGQTLLEQIYYGFESIKGDISALNADFDSLKDLINQVNHQLNDYGLSFDGEQISTRTPTEYYVLKNNYIKDPSDETKSVIDYGTLFKVSGAESQEVFRFDYSDSTNAGLLSQGYLDLEAMAAYIQQNYHLNYGASESELGLKTFDVIWRQDAQVNQTDYIAANPNVEYFRFESQHYQPLYQLVKTYLQLSGDYYDIIKSIPDYLKLEYVTENGIRNGEVRITAMSGFDVQLDKSFFVKDSVVVSEELDYRVDVITTADISKLKNGSAIPNGIRINGYDSAQVIIDQVDGDIEQSTITDYQGVSLENVSVIYSEGTLSTDHIRVAMQGGYNRDFLWESSEDRPFSISNLSLDFSGSTGFEDYTSVVDLGRANIQNELNLFMHDRSESTIILPEKSTGTSYVQTGQFNDVIIGSLGKDVIKSGDGDDILVGMGGDDGLDGGLGADLLIAGQWKKMDAETEFNPFSPPKDNQQAALILFDRLDDLDDWIEFKSGHAIISGGMGSGLTGDYIIGGEGSDVISLVYGLATGSAGDDLLSITGSGTLYGGAGDDVIRLQYDQGNIAFGEEGHDLIYGSVGSDTIYGGDGNDLVQGGLGNNYLYGGNGNDQLIDGIYLSGGLGQDILENNNDYGDQMVFLAGDYGRITTANGQYLVIQESTNYYSDLDSDDQLSNRIGFALMMGGRGQDTFSGVSVDDRIFQDATLLSISSSMAHDRVPYSDRDSISASLLSQMQVGKTIADLDRDENQKRYLLEQQAQTLQNSAKDRQNRADSLLEQAQIASKNIEQVNSLLTILESGANLVTTKSSQLSSISVFTQSNKIQVKQIVTMGSDGDLVIDNNIQSMKVNQDGSEQSIQSNVSEQILTTAVIGSGSNKLTVAYGEDGEMKGILKEGVLIEVGTDVYHLELEAIKTDQAADKEAVEQLEKAAEALKLEAEKDQQSLEEKQEEASEIKAKELEEAVEQTNEIEPVDQQSSLLMPETTLAEVETTMALGALGTLGKRWYKTTHSQMVSTSKAIDKGFKWQNGKLTRNIQL